MGHLFGWNFLVGKVPPSDIWNKARYEVSVIVKSPGSSVRTSTICFSPNRPAFKSLGEDSPLFVLRNSLQCHDGTLAPHFHIIFIKTLMVTCFTFQHYACIAYQINIACFTCLVRAQSLIHFSAIFLSLYFIKVLNVALKTLMQVPSCLHMLTPHTPISMTRASGRRRPTTKTGPPKNQYLMQPHAMGQLLRSVEAVPE